MRAETFSELLRSIDDALRHARGAKRCVRTTRRWRPAAPGENEGGEARAVLPAGEVTSSTADFGVPRWAKYEIAL